MTGYSEMSVAFQWTIQQYAPVNRTLRRFKFSASTGAGD